MPPRSLLDDIVLAPGDWAVGDSDARIRTMLGSCVSITLWHPRRRVGAMSHFLLASRSRAAGAPLDGRYGEEALALMLQALEARCVNARECQAKVFGGGNMFPDQVGGGSHVGQRNGEAARMLLEGIGVNIHSQSLFGIGHRQVVFDIASGDVWSRQVQPASGLMPLDLS